MLPKDNRFMIRERVYLMARKETITKDEILNAAFEMARQDGFAQVSARTLAAKAGCSTQPIFRVYKNMEELGEDLFGKATNFLMNIVQKPPRSARRLL